MQIKIFHIARILFIFLAMTPFIANAADALPSFAYVYARDMINQFASVKDIVMQPTPASTASDTNPFENLLSQLTELKKQLDEFGATIKNYENSDDPEIKQSATLLNTEVFILSASTQNGIEICEKNLNEPTRIINQRGTVAREIDEFKASHNKAWDTYAMGGTTLSYGLMQAADRNNLNSKIIPKMSRTEVAMLKSQIISEFGSSVTKGLTTSTPMVAVPAAQLWTFLSGK
jgi:hypothetical protein